MTAIRAAMEKAPLVPHPLAAGAITPYDALLQARNMSKIPPEKPEQDEEDTPKDGIRVTADGEDEDENDQKSKNDNKAATRDPVNAVTGEVVLSQTDFTVPWRIPVTWTRHYGHQRRHTGLCGLNWHSPADIRLQLKANGKVLFYGPDPKAHVFKRLDNARPVREVSDGALLERCEQGLRVTTKQGLSYHFAEPDPKKRSQTLYVEKITDRCGNRLHYERDEHGLCRIGDNSGNALAVRTRMGRIVTIHLALESGDRLLARYDYDPQNNLFTVFDALNTSHRFAYEKKALVRHTDRTGFSVHYQYDNKGRCIRVTGDDRYYYGELEYGDGCTTVTDSLGHQQVFEYNAAGRITAIIAPDGGKTRYTYDSAGRTKTVTDPAGNTTEYSYDNAGNLDGVAYADGANLLISYNADHRPGSCMT